MDIYLIRHTSLDCPKGVCYGHSDIDVSDNFNVELESVKSKLPELDDFVFYSSPLKRCIKLASSLALNGYTADERLKEHNFGDWELKKWSELVYCKCFQKWKYEFINNPSPNGESTAEVYKRCEEFFEELILKDHKKIAIITHSGVIRMIAAKILGMPLDKAFSLGLDYASVSKVNINGQITSIEYINR